MASPTFLCGYHGQVNRWTMTDLNRPTARHLSTAHHIRPDHGYYFFSGQDSSHMHPSQDSTGQFPSLFRTLAIHPAVNAQKRIAKIISFFL